MNKSSLQKDFLKIGRITESEWMQMGRQNALKKFHLAAQNVPAYRDFLRKHKISPNTIKTFNDFLNLPITDKSNYINQYDLKDLMWPNQNSNPNVINSSSGSTGKPNYWLTSHDEFEVGKLFHQFIFDRIFKLENKKTLIIINFGMGTWVAGIFTFLSTYLYSGENNQSLSIITPGFNREETIQALVKLSPSFKKILFIGYPTFVKDVLERWMSMQKFYGELTFLFAGEPISEKWRDYILQKTKAKNIYTSVINIFGSADAALMGFETPTSILIRKQCEKNKALNLSLFNDERTPSTAVYLPTHVFFETVNNELILTMDRSIPLIRYNIHDHGGILESERIFSHTYLNKLIRDSRLEKYNFRLPTVYLFGRGIFGATIYAANIYPENVKEVLIHKQVREYVSGRFFLSTKYDDTQNNYLNLSVELRENIKATKMISKIISKTFCLLLKKSNSEFQKVHEEYGRKVEPKVELVSYGQGEFSTNKKFTKSS